MPSVKVCLWNIQNYGQESRKYGGFTNRLRNRFIANFAVKHEIDVLFIQEVDQEPHDALFDLRTYVNWLYPDEDDQDWRASWCGSAIASRRTDEVTEAGQLTYRTGARTEGYAVMWRGDRDTFDVVAAINDIGSGNIPTILRSPLNISQRGRPARNNRIGGMDERFSATGGFTLAQPFPYDYDEEEEDYVLLDHWPRLNYPGTSRLDAMGLQWAKSRRPVYVVLQLSDGRLCPVSVYHAPSNQTRSSWGAYIAGLSREIYATNAVENYLPVADRYVAVRASIFGGDFNRTVSAGDWPGDYAYFTSGRQRTYAGGASNTGVPAPPATDAQRRTTVQIVSGAGHDVPITGANNSDYLQWKIDLVFFPTGAGTAAERIDLLNELRTDGAVYSRALKKTAAMMDDLEVLVANPPRGVEMRLTPTGPQVKRRVRRNHTWVDVWVAMISGSWGGTFVDWNETKRQFAAGQVADARRAAEYLHIFVSDHLPLVATIDV